MGFILFLAALVLAAEHRLYIVVVSGGYSLVVVHKFLIAVAFLVAEHRL